MPLWVRSLLARPAGAGLFVLVALTIAAAAVGPILARAVEQGALRNALGSAPATDTSVAITDQAGQYEPLDVAIRATRAAARSAAAGTVFDSALVSTAESANALAVRPSDSTAPGSAFSARIAARTDGCRAVTVISGRCPTTARELLVGLEHRAALGQTLLVGPRHLPFSVVGVYDTTRPAPPLPSDAFSAAARTGPDLVTTLSGAARFDVSISVVTRSQLLISKIGIEQLPAVHAGLRAGQRAVLANRSSQLSFDSGLPALLDRVSRERTAASGLVIVVCAQVLALALACAIAVMTALARARSREWALSRLRSVRRPAWIAAVYAEPVAILVIGSVAGFALGVGVARIATDVLVPASPVEPWRAPVLATAALVTIGLAAGLVAASVRSARAPLGTLLRDGAEPVRASRLVLVGETLVLVLAVAAVYQLSQSSTLSGPRAGLALVAPGLLSVAVSLLTIRVVLGVARRSTRRAPRGVTGLLVRRRLLRAPSRLRRDSVIAIASAVAVFAVQLAALDGRNQLLHAQAQVGAQTVLDVRVPAGRNLLQLVRAADPRGTRAMAVEQRGGANDPGGQPLVAVDSARLARISPWRSGWAGLDPRALARALHPSTPIGPVVLSGASIEVSLRDVSVTAFDPESVANSGLPAASASMIWTVADSAGWHDVRFGPMTGNSAATTLRAALPCPHGCRLVQIALAPVSGSAYRASFVLAGVRTSAQPSSSFAGLLTRTSAWQAVPAVDRDRAVPVVAALPDGLHVQVEDEHVSGGAFAPADVTRPLPIVAGAAVDTTPVPGQSGIVDVVGLDGRLQAGTVVARAAVVPRGLDDAVLVDLADLAALSNAANDVAQAEVWLAPGPQREVRRALSAAGVTVTGTHTLAAARAVISRTGPARAVLVDLALVLLAAALTLAALVAAQLIGSTERRRLWAATAIAGLPRSATRRAVFLELAVPACGAALLGGAAGLVAILLAGTRLPLFSAGVVGPPLDVAPDWALLASTLVITLVTLLALAGVSAAAQSASARRTSR